MVNKPLKFAPAFQKKSLGFTLIELMVAITILAILSTIGLVTYQKGIIASRDGVRKTKMRQLQTPLELYMQRNGTYPASLSDLVPNFVDSLPKDPKTNADYQYFDGSDYYVLCTTLENTADQDIPATMDTNCSAGTNFFIRYP